MKCKFSAILAICLVVFPLSLLAQTEKSELPDTTQINEVVITGTKNAVSRNNRRKCRIGPASGAE
jgi:hypothetical protein